MKEFVLLVLFLVALMCSCIIMGFALGKTYMKNQFLKYTPPIMDKMCAECERIGEKDGYRKGIKTCDDVIDTMNSGGRR